MLLGAEQPQHALPQLGGSSLGWLHAQQEPASSASLLIDLYNKKTGIFTPKPPLAVAQKTTEPTSQKPLAAELLTTTSLQPTMVDVTMHTPVPDAGASGAAAPPPFAPTSDCYSLKATFGLAAYSNDGQPVSHDGTHIAPNWFALALCTSARGGAAATPQQARQYGQVLNALAARLRNTLNALLSHENLGLCEIGAQLELRQTHTVEPIAPRAAQEELLQDDDASKAVASATFTVEPDVQQQQQHASVDVTLRIDPLTSHMLRTRFDEYDRLKQEEILDDPVPYGHEDLLWGQTISEMFWLAGAEMRADVKRRDAVAFDQCLCDAEMLKVPNAPPHVATEQTQDPTTHGSTVRWRMAVAPMAEA